MKEILLSMSQDTKTFFHGAECGSVKVMRTGLRLRDAKRRDTASFDGNDSILILQDAFHHQELFSREQ